MDASPVIMGSHGHMTVSHVVVSWAFAVSGLCVLTRCSLSSPRPLSDLKQVNGILSQLLP